MKKTSVPEELVEIRPIELATTEVTIVGDAPLIMHAWDEKAKLMMLNAQRGKAKGKAKDPKNPPRDFIESMYWLTEKPELSDKCSEQEAWDAFEAAIARGARFGFPVTAIKQATISAAFRKGWLKNKMALRGQFFIDSDFGDMVEILSDKPEMREDMVKVGMGTADIRYRGQFDNWSATFALRYDKNGQYDLEALVNMINAGGIVCGIGEWRPERDGQFGLYHVKVR